MRVAVNSLLDGRGLEPGQEFAVLLDQDTAFGVHQRDIADDGRVMGGNLFRVALRYNPPDQFAEGFEGVTHA